VVGETSHAIGQGYEAAFGSKEERIFRCLDGGLKLYCPLLPDSEVHVMRSTDLVDDTRQEVARVKEVLGDGCSGGIVFNCILRRLELDAKHLHEPFLKAFAGMEVAGFHTYGESFLGHINQTLTGIWFK